MILSLIKKHDEIMGTTVGVSLVKSEYGGFYLRALKTGGYGNPIDIKLDKHDIEALIDALIQVREWIK